MAIVGHLTVGHQKAFRELREEVQCSCHGWSLTSTNIIRLCSGREILKPLGGSSMCLGMKTAVVNQFLPNRRHLINELESANLFSQFVKDGSELMVASKDESIRFFQQCLPGDRYSMKNVVHVPFVSLDIYDVAMNPMGDALCYATWSVSIFYARLNEPRSDNTIDISWTKCRILSQDITMKAVMSLRFPQDGHEILRGDSHGNVHILDLESMSEVAMINYAHYGAANTVCYDDTHPHLLYTGGADGHVKVYDRRALGEFDDQPVGVFAGHENLITYIDARGDGRYLISNSMDNSIKLWDLRRFCGCETMQETVECVRQQLWEYSWQSILCAKKSTLKKDTSVLTFRGHTVDHRSVRAKFSPRRTGRRYIYTGSERGQVVVYDILASSPSEVAVFDPGLDPVHCRLYNYMRALRDVDWNPTTNEIVTVEWNGVTLIWKWDKFYINFRPGVENRSDAKNIREESCEPVVKR